MANNHDFKVKNGLNVTGNIIVGGTVAGRNLELDGNKLDGVSTGAEANPSASSMLTSIKTVDGASSGLDSDLLDGQHGTYYTSYTDTAIANLIDSSPGTLNTLNELAAALGDDANFSTTVTNSIATKLPLAGGTLTGDLQATGLYVGSTNTSYDFYNNGTTYLNGATTIDDNTQINGTLVVTSDINVGAQTGTWITSNVMSDAIGWNTNYGVYIGSNIGGTHYLRGNGTFTTGGSTYNLFHDGYHPNADKWTTARTLSLSGDASGSVSWDGSANATLSVAVADDSHNHDGRYYTETEADSRFANVAGDTFTGLVLIDQELKIQNGSGNHTHFNYNDGSDNFIRGGTTYVDTVLDLNNNNLNDVGNLTVNTNISVGGTVDGVDIAAFKTAYDSHNHDSRYYTESEINTFINRSYVSQHNASGLAVGWYTIAQNTGDRAVARFALWDTNSSDHQAVIFYASHHFGTDSSNTLTVLDNSYYSGNPFRYIRIKDAGTYDGAALQVYIDDASNSVNIAIVGDDVQTSGWDIVDFLADASAPSLVSNWANFGERSRVDLNQIAQGGLATTGPIYADGDTTQYRVFNDNYHPNADAWTTSRTLTLSGDASGSVSIDGSSNVSLSVSVGDADTVDGVHGSSFLRSDTADTASGDITFSGGAGAITVSAGSDLRFTAGDWTGEHSGKIQYHSNHFYFQAAGFWNFRNNSGTNVISFSNGGNITLSGTVDGRDVAADGTKLDTIATNANNYSFPYTVSTNASNSTVVQRNSSGYIFANYFNTTPNTVASGVTQICVETGNDGYIRHGTADAVRSFLNVASGANNYSLPAGPSYVDVATGNYGTVKVDDDRGVSWAGYAIRDDWVLMSDGANNCGIYNDTDNEWGLLCRRNAEVELYHNGSLKLETRSDGITVSGHIVGPTDIYVDDQIISTGDTNTYMQFHASDQWRVVVGGSERLEVKNSSPHVYVSGDFAATGNITAYYSDERLKTKTGNIENALDKINSLQGFYYVENDLARSFGFKSDKTQVALSAQQVQNIMPECVSLAPFDIADSEDFETGEELEPRSKSGENYLTVDYARLVPLLVEAIKDQQKQIDKLKERLG